MFGPSHGFSKENIPNDWVIEGSNYKELFSRNLIINDIGDTPILRLISSKKSFVLLRRTRANLLASPFLGWSWNVTTSLGQTVPISIIIGFYGGDPKSRSWGSQPLVYLGSRVPPHDRTITIVWGTSSDAKGIIKMKHKIPYYIARAGSNDSKTWLNENIDLSRLYRRIWPKDNLVRTRIMFVGFTSASTSSPMTAEFGDVVLYR